MRGLLLYCASKLLDGLFTVHEGRIVFFVEELLTRARVVVDLLDHDGYPMFSGTP